MKKSVSLLLILSTLFILGCGDEEQKQAPSKENTNNTAVKKKLGSTVQKIVDQVNSSLNRTADMSYFLEQAGDNRAELEKVLTHYKEDEEKRKAAKYLISNMEGKGLIGYDLLNEKGNKVNFDPLSFSTYPEMKEAWKKLEKREGALRYKSYIEKEDLKTIEAQQLIENIDLAYEAWERTPWKDQYEVECFYETILPHRSTQEPLENWRAQLYEKYSWVIDSVGSSGSPVEAAVLINEDLKNQFRFDRRFYKHPKDLGLAEMIELKAGRGEDMANFAIYAMRAVGIPVMYIYTPWWSHIEGNLAWNVVLSQNGDLTDFMGCGVSPGAYNVRTKRFAKVHITTFSTREKETDDKEMLPPFMRRENTIDVTRIYTAPVSDIEQELTAKEEEKAYLCVKNGERMRAIEWGQVVDNKVMFKDVGRNILYYPMYRKDKEYYPAGASFYLDREGGKTELIADHNQLSNLILTTKRLKEIQKGDDDLVIRTNIKENVQYVFMYWNDGEWKELEKLTSKEKTVKFQKIPGNTMYKIHDEDGSWQSNGKAFLIQEGRQVWI